MKKIVILISFLLAGYLSVIGQTQEGIRTTIILYNVTPLKVDLAPDGTIINIHGKEDDYFKGYSLVKNDDSSIDLVASNTEFYKPNVGYTVAPKAFNLDFRSDLALLSSKAIAAIDEAVVYLTANPDQKIMITPYKASLSKDNQLLLDNRLKTALMYLEIKGIPKGKIALNQDVQSTNPNQLILTFLK
ncbi:MAG TPA: hypothetical protein PKD85_11175 [Saprospiraceae bacterium]|nr:hypothetical protein [Saprospiraceae bacterium]